MAGGIGSRFWPLSTPEYPKQFIDVTGRGRSLLQMTCDRFAALCPIERTWVVTNAAYVPIVRQQLPQIPDENILAEPAARNTAPCIAYAGWKIRQKHPEANIIVAPSDAYVRDDAEFRRIIGEALSYTCDRNAIVTIGITPTRPETGYGYIQMETAGAEGEIRKVASFREKPDKETARAYLEAGCYLWNAGIFVWNIKTLEESIRSYVPDIAEGLDAIAQSFYTKKEGPALAEAFPKLRKISIDYAVMEHHPGIHTIPADFGWSDLGNWASLHSLLESDAEGNAAVGPVRFVECSGCIAHVQGTEKVVLQGLQDCIISCSGGRMLICRKSEEQRIRDWN
ncbi:MAG: mannose-1-phosphate guanylyltransferase [Bacteroidales bacterium]|nr:mannose-1-phosphate guanylyltransferase [Bacteroidales bacterium]